MRTRLSLLLASAAAFPLAAVAQTTYTFAPGCNGAGCLSATVIVGPPTQVPGSSPGTFGTPVTLNVGAFTPAPQFEGRLDIQRMGIVGSIRGTATGPISRELPSGCSECLFGTNLAYFALGFVPVGLNVLVGFTGPAAGVDAPPQGSFALQVVPEPGTVALAATGLALVGMATRRRRA